MAKGSVSLLKHLLAFRKADQRAISAALAAAERAVSKAEEAAEKRFDGLNELRGVVTDLLATLISRTEANAKFDALSKELGAALARLDKMEGSSGGKSQGFASINSMLPWIVAIAALAYSILHH